MGDWIGISERTDAPVQAAAITSSFISIRSKGVGGVGIVGTLWASEENLVKSLPTSRPVQSPYSKTSSFVSFPSSFAQFTPSLSFWRRDPGGTVKTSSGLSRRSDQQKEDQASIPSDSSESAVRIAIIGGGIAGITAASSIALRLQQSQSPSAKIVIFEGDTNSNFPYQTHQPQWTAATARNANSIVPGASMHMMAQRSTLYSIARDTVSEWLMLHFETLQHFRKRVTSSSFVPVLNIDNFEVVPPYFALHLFKCLGTSATSEERRSFITFLKHFVSTSLFTGQKEADDRAEHIMKLAKANRVALLRDWDDMSTTAGDKYNKSELGIGRGFLSLHRSEKAADHAVEEAKQFGERAELVPWEKAVELEPRIRNLPFGPLYAVHRPDDLTANCLRYVQNLRLRCKKRLGITFREREGGIVKSVERVKKEGTVFRESGRMGKIPVTAADGSSYLTTDGLSKGKTARFRITTADGTVHDADILILAAGVNTPLFAQQVGAGHCCPTYPLRGFSLTIHTEGPPLMKGGIDNNTVDEGDNHNLMNRPISVDSMYCSSVGPNMARLAGYGELVGYREKAVDVPSVGPRVLARYGRTIFPDAVGCVDESATQCFRPMSPDDLPLVGKVSCVPGLLLHTGHGTLGWTMSLATAECVAQAVCDEVNGGKDAETFELPDKTKISRSVLSPDRFL